MHFFVSAVATVLMLFVLMPLYKTAGCDPQTLGLETCLNQQNLTDFEQLTIANVPPYSFSPLLNGTTAIVINGTYTVIVGQRENPLAGLLWVPGLTGRYAAPTVIMVIITIYSCYLLWHEWIECLALRRVYFLESNYFMERIEELDTIKCNKDPEDPFQAIRPPYLPHPEMRETIPNVSLNSVLYQLPNSLKEYKSKTVNGKSIADDGKNLLERQLDATVQFFDKCVPNQPGFTSSVIAVTIVPDAALVKGAWMKWYACGKKLRRLRYIKHVIAKRKEMQEAGVHGFRDYIDTAVKTTGDVARATGKATTDVAKATGNAVIQATEKVRASGHSDNSLSRSKSDKSKSDKEEDKKSEASNGEEVILQQPYAITGMMNDDSENSERDDKEKDESDENKGSWFQQIATTVGFGGASDDNTEGNELEEAANAENNPMASVYHDAESGVEQAFSNDASGKATILKSGGLKESGVYFDANETRVETERFSEPASPRTPKGNNTGDQFEYETFDPEEFAQWIGYAEETQCDEI
ncbi:MAG: hypothetical protein SGARI_001753, partial [Bacillariaceae sp.]